LLCRRTAIGSPGVIDRLAPELEAMESEDAVGASPSQPTTTFPSLVSTNNMANNNQGFSSEDLAAATESNAPNVQATIAQPFMTSPPAATRALKEKKTKAFNTIKVNGHVYTSRRSLVSNGILSEQQKSSSLKLPQNFQLQSL